MNQNYRARSYSCTATYYREHGGTPKPLAGYEGIYIGPQLEDDQFTIDGENWWYVWFPKKNMPFNEGDVIEIDKRTYKIIEIQWNMRLKRAGLLLNN